MRGTLDDPPEPVIANQEDAAEVIVAELVRRIRAQQGCGDGGRGLAGGECRG